MPNVIDSLVVELALDARKLNEQTRGALDQFARTKEALKQQGNEIESQGARMLDMFGGLKRMALGFAGVFLGYEGIKGFAQFVTHMNNLEASTGRLAKTMNISTGELSVWQGAAQRMGNTAEGITGTLQMLSTETNKFMLNGQTSLLGPLTQLGVTLTDNNGRLKTATQLFKEITAAAENLAKSDPARARALLGLLGFDQGAVNMAIEGQGKLQKALDDTATALNKGFTDDEVKKAKEFQDALASVEQSLLAIKRALLSYVEGPLGEGLKIIGRLLGYVVSPGASWSGLAGFIMGGGLKGGSSAPAPAGGGDNMDRFLGGLSYLETNQRNVGNAGSSATGFFQFLNGTAAMATRGGLPDPRAGDYAAQSAATRAFIERYYPAAASAIARGDFATAEALLNKVWPSLPGGSQMQSPDRYRRFNEMLAPGARHSSSINNSRSSTSSTKIDIGSVNINAPSTARSADHLAAEIKPALQRQLAIAAYNTGQA